VLLPGLQEVRGEQPEGYEHHERCEVGPGDQTDVLRHPGISVLIHPLECEVENDRDPCVQVVDDRHDDHIGLVDLAPALLAEDQVRPDGAHDDQEEGGDDDGDNVRHDKLLYSGTHALHRYINIITSICQVLIP
jgi:hypothetical protein